MAWHEHMKLCMIAMTVSATGEPNWLEPVAENPARGNGDCQQKWRLPARWVADIAGCSPLVSFPPRRRAPKTKIKPNPNPKPNPKPCVLVRCVVSRSLCRCLSFVSVSWSCLSLCLCLVCPWSVSVSLLSLFHVAYHDVVSVSLWSLVSPSWPPWP